MFLIDFSQASIASITVFMDELKVGANAKQVEDLSRHALISSLLSYKKKYSQKYGEMVIACDDTQRKYWRRIEYPYYKEMRRRNKEASEIDWNLIHTSLNKIREELMAFFPWKMLVVDNCEADDIFGVLTKYSQENDLITVGLEEEAQPILAISSDTDNTQLFKYSNYQQWCPLQKKLLKKKNKEELRKFVTEHVVKGDTGDGVPNIFSRDDYFVTRADGERQKSVTQAMLDAFVLKGEDAIDSFSEKQLNGYTVDALKVNYRRNSKLIMYDEIPEAIESSIIKSYKSYNPVGEERSLESVRKYFIRNRCKLLMEELTNIG